MTGGASGMCQSIAVALASEGAKVRVADIRPADETLLRGADMFVNVAASNAAQSIARVEK